MLFYLLLLFIYNGSDNQYNATECSNTKNYYFILKSIESSIRTSVPIIINEEIITQDIAF